MMTSKLNMKVLDRQKESHPRAMAASPALDHRNKDPPARVAAVQLTNKGMAVLY
jgi:hypothetical protein